MRDLNSGRTNRVSCRAHNFIPCDHGLFHLEDHTNRVLIRTDGPLSAQFISRHPITRCSFVLAKCPVIKYRGQLYIVFGQQAVVQVPDIRFLPQAVAKLWGQKTKPVFHNEEGGEKDGHHRTED
jgi:hypothetical protein